MSPDQHVKSQADAFRRQNPNMTSEGLYKRAQRRLAGNISAQDARRVIIEIADEFASKVAKLTPCKRGCSGCCHLSAAIWESEAQRLAKVTGKPMAQLPPLDIDAMQRSLLEGRDKHYGTPCPFLVNGECSVYEDRPSTCRVHHTILPDASRCAPTQENRDAQIPKISSFQGLDLIQAQVHMQLGERMADIRDWFAQPGT